MSVYVDEPMHPFGRMVMCHMLADTREELLAMVDKIGVPQKWIQKKDTAKTRLGLFQLSDDEGWSTGVIATGKAEAIRRYTTEITELENDIEATRIPAKREVRISWIDDKPTLDDVPEGGRIEPVPSAPEYLSIVATAAQWCAYYEKAHRTFAVLWETDW